MQRLAPIGVAAPAPRPSVDACAPSIAARMFASAGNRAIDTPRDARGPTLVPNRLLETDIDEVPLFVFRSRGEAAYREAVALYEMQGQALERALCDDPAFVERHEHEVVVGVAPLALGEPLDTQACREGERLRLSPGMRNATPVAVRFDEANLADTRDEAARFRAGQRASRHASVIGKWIERVACFFR